MRRNRLPSNSVVRVLSMRVAAVAAFCATALFMAACKKVVASIIIDGNVPVAAGKFVYYKIDVPSNASLPRMHGRFHVSGGVDNDIVMNVLPEDAFVSFAQGHSATVLYSSGRVTQATLDTLNLAAGKTYYIVFQNTFSSIADKMVDAHLELDYKA
jgi:hypothetical protein